jgi:hypothetical protein
VRVCSPDPCCALRHTQWIHIHVYPAAFNIYTCICLDIARNIHAYSYSPHTPWSTARSWRVEQAPYNLPIRRPQTYIHIYVCYTHTHTYTCIYMHVYICMYIHVYMCVYRSIYLYVYIHTHVSQQARRRFAANSAMARKCIYIYTYTYSYIYICIYTHVSF